MSFELQLEPDAELGPAVDVAADAPPVACTVAACPPGFSVVDGGCYQLVVNRTMWLDAEHACEAVGAHLVVEDSVEEHYTVHSLATSGGGEGVWIGWTDRRGPDNTYTWVVPDAGGLLQSNGCVFAAGEPDAGDGDHCAEQVAADACGDYFDLDCASTFHYICECDGVLADPSRY